MGVQACRLPAPKPLKPSKPLKPLKRFKPLKLSKLCQSVSGQIPCFFWRSSLLFTRHSPPTGSPRPHQWLLMGVQASRLPAPKPLKPSKPLKPLKRLKPFKTLKTLPKRLGPDPLLFLTVQFAVHQAFAANRQPKATSMASYGRPSLPFASPQTPKTPKTTKTLKTL